MNEQTSTVKMLGIDIGSVPLNTLISDAESAIDGTRGQISFACANPHSLVVARKDNVFRTALNNAEQLVADGVGVILAGRFTKNEVQHRITGADYYFALMDKMNQRSKRVFFLGSTPKVLGKIEQRLKQDFPDINVATLSPPFGEWTEEQRLEVIKTINDFKPDVVWVGMTAPKQEKWVEANRGEIDAAVLGSIGAVFDFYAGTHPRAPDWMHDNGLEWAYRLCREPRRMWRRNFVSAPKFILAVGMERLRGIFNSSPASA